MHLIETGHHEVNADGDPDLGLHGVGAGTIKGFDSQVLFDPFEEQFDMPSALVDGGDRQGRQFELIGQEGQRLTGLWIDVSDSSQFGGIIRFAFVDAQSNDLIAAQATGLVDGIGLADVEAEIAFGSCDKEGSSLFDTMKSGEVDVSTIHYINASSFDQDLVEYVHVVDTPLCDADEYRDGASKIHEGVQLDGRLGLPKGGPGKHRKAKIYGCGIEGVNHLLDSQSVIFRSIKASGLSDENLSQIGKNPPIPFFVGISQIASSDVAADPHCVEVAAVAQTGFDVAQALPVGHLRKGHAQELIATAEGAAASRHRVSTNTSRQLRRIEDVHDLREYESSGVHLLLRLNLNQNGYPFQMQDTLASLKDHDGKQLTQN